jgi:glycerol-3-phosphate acyltransferase PlsY
MLVLLLLAYLCGSIPFGLMIVRAVAGVDLRAIGSGNIGASNVGRAAGKKWAVIVLVLDALKGAGPTLAGPWLADRFGSDIASQTAQVLAGMAAILGHMFPVWLGFRGGKGVATALGVILILSPPATAAAALAFVITFAVRRIVSLSSLLAAVTFGVVQIWQLRPDFFGEENRAMAIFAIAVPALVFVRHLGNIARLLRGEEAVYRTADTRKTLAENRDTDAQPK